MKTLPCSRIFFAFVISSSSLPVLGVNIEDAQSTLARYQASPTANLQEELLEMASELIEEGLQAEVDRRSEEDRAIGKLEIAHALRQAVFGENHIETIDAGFNLARIYSFYGWTAKADALLVELYNSALQVLPEDDVYLADLFFYLGNYRAVFGLRQPTQYYREAIRIYSKNLGPESQQVAYVLERLSAVTMEFGNLEDAIELAEEALRIIRLQPEQDSGVLATAIVNISNAYGQLGEYEKAVEIQQALLAEAQDLRRYQSHFDCGVGLVMRQLRRRDEYEMKIPLTRELLECGDMRLANALFYGQLGALHRRYGFEDEAREAFRRSASNGRMFARSQRGNIPASLGGSFSNQGLTNDDSTPIESARRALSRSIDRRDYDHPLNIDILLRLANALSSERSEAEAISYYESALALLSKHDPYNLYRFTNFFSGAALSYWVLGDLEEARTYAEAADEAFKTLEEINEGVAEISGMALASGRIQMSMLMGDFDEAERRAVETIERAKRIRGEKHPATLSALISYANFHFALNNSAKVIEIMDEHAAIIATRSANHDLDIKAGAAFRDFNLGNLEEALAQYEELTGDRRARMNPGFYRTIRSNIGRISSRLGRHEKAVEIYTDILNDRDMRDRDASIIASWNVRLASAQLGQGQLGDAIDLLEDSYVALLTTESDFEIWESESLLSKAYRQSGNLGAAIYFAKSAVNRLQNMRDAMQGFDSSAQVSFVDNKRNVYRDLADLFIELGDIQSAQFVISMLKNAEYQDYVLRSYDGNVLDSVTISEIEQDITQDLDTLRSNAHLLGAEVRNLQKRRSSLTRNENNQLRDLEREMSQLLRSFQDELQSVKGEFAQLGVDRIIELGEKNLFALGALQATLSRLGNDVAIVHYLVLPEKVSIILTTSTASSSYQSEIALSDLNGLVFDMRETVDFPGEIDFVTSQALYDLLILPIESTLSELGIQNLMLSLDSTLRYLPFAALSNNGEYLVQKYQLSRYTPAAALTIEREPSDSWRVASFGVSEGYENYSPLPSVPDELDAIVIEGRDDITGVLFGVVVLNDEFTSDRFSEELAKTDDESYQVVHIATHFDFKSGADTESALLAGNGERIAVSDFRSGKYSLNQVELLTLSACKTGVSGLAPDGSEIEGFSALAQNQGAAAVLSTLWSVADSSTSKFMRDFYDARTNGSLTKVGALQSIQQKFIASGDSGQDFSHPFFWAPFVLTGNWL